MSEIKRPLEGIKVVELATFIAAPCCARFLADLGAEVIKIEAPAGDPLRYTAVNEGRPQDQKENTTYDLENANKTCIALNTKSPAGREALEKLIAGADIFITGDVKYHTALDTQLCLFDVGHHSLEEEMMRRAAIHLQHVCPMLEVVFVPSASPFQPVHPRVL